MGQGEVLKLLKGKVKPLSARQISEELNDNFDKITKVLRKLVKNNEVGCVEINRMQAQKYFNIKRKLRLYYLNYNNIAKARKAFTSL